MERNSELVSVIIPVYNAEKYLQKCLDSIVNQTYSNLEIIIVNDGSTDNSLSIINKYCMLDDRIVTLNKINGGLSDARNTALDYFHGDYVVFVDSDDWIDLNLIEKCIGLCRLNTCDVVCFAYYKVDEKGDYEVEGCNVEEEITVSKNDAIRLLNEEKIIQSHVCNKFYRSSCFERIRFPYGRAYEDSFTMYKLFLEINYVTLINAPLYYYFQRSDSIVHTPSLKNQLDLIDSYIQRYEHLKNFVDHEQKNKIITTLKRKYILLRRYFYKNKTIKEKEKWITRTCHMDDIKSPAVVEILFKISILSHPLIYFIYKIVGNNTKIYKALNRIYRDNYRRDEV